MCPLMELGVALGAVVLNYTYYMVLPFVYSLIFALNLDLSTEI